MEALIKLQALSEMLSKTLNIYSCNYDEAGMILSTTSPKALIINTFFSLSGCKDYLLKQGTDSHLPIILSSKYGSYWIALYNESERLFHTIGPFFATNMTEAPLRKTLSELKLPLSQRNDLVHFLLGIPPISLINAYQFAQFLYYCIYDEPIHTAHIPFIAYENSEPVLTNDPEKVDYPSSFLSLSDKKKAWLAEEHLLKNIKEGNIFYQDSTQLNYFNDFFSTKISFNSNGSLRDEQNGGIAFVSLCARAAMEGGLSPDTAYSLSSSYIQTIKNCVRIDELGMIYRIVYDDFTKRVHNHKKSTQLSEPIQNCCDYIELHVEEDLSIDTIASNIGYTKYYLTRKFKKETGKTLGDYIKASKVSRAKQLLSTTSSPILEISNQLNFSCASYFADTFQKLVGVSPTQYRLTHKMT